MWWTAMRCTAERDLRLLFIGTAFAVFSVAMLLKFLVSGNF
jgi:hypothetical protein